MSAATEPPVITLEASIRVWRNARGGFTYEVHSEGSLLVDGDLPKSWAEDVEERIGRGDADARPAPRPVRCGVCRGELSLGDDGEPVPHDHTDDSPEIPDWAIDRPRGDY